MSAKRYFYLLLMLFITSQALAQMTESVHPEDFLISNSADGTEINQIIDGTFELYQFLRNDIGVYADAARFSDNQFHPCSIASVGMGLISLCIADTLALIDNAEALTVQTLKAMAGEIAGFEPARNPVNGFFRHWIDMKTGARAWNSEYSSIDTGILVSGALFCKKYFADNWEISRLADALFMSVDWSKAISNTDRGEIYMTFDEQGKGVLKTLPFNEYMIVAWLAKHDLYSATRAEILWEKHYENASDLPTSTYNDISLLTDSPGHYLSNFVIQFPYYLCHHFTVRDDYLIFLHNAMQADRAWWGDTSAPNYAWGTGAGASGFSGSGYNADNFNNNPGTVCSPHILAGFSPIDATVADDILNLWTNNLGVYQVPGSTKKFLWRFSISKPDWRADDVQGVDVSTLLFGLAAHPSMLGKEFFEKFNNFDFPDLNDVGETRKENDLNYDLYVNIYPNPFNAVTTIEYQLDTQSNVNIRIYDIQGRTANTFNFAEQKVGMHLFHFDASYLSSGLYIACVQTRDSMVFQKLLLAK